MDREEVLVVFATADLCGYRMSMSAGADNKDVFRRFTPVVALLLDPAAVLCWSQQLSVIAA